MRKRNIHQKIILPLCQYDLIMMMMSNYCMVLSNYFYLMIISLHIVIWFQVTSCCREQMKPLCMRMDYSC